MNEYKLRQAAKPMVFDINITPAPASLALLINPTTFDIKYTPKISEQRVRWTGIDADTSSSNAYIFHVHHDELDVITAAGKSAMFLTDSEGLTRINRTDTYGYKNVERLVAFYRNNGMNLNRSKNSSGAINSVGRVKISYDNFIYEGHFISFSFSENDTSPFNVDFSFDFKVTKTFSKDQITGWI